MRQGHRCSTKALPGVSVCVSAGVCVSYVCVCVCLCVCVDQADDQVLERDQGVTCQYIRILYRARGGVHPSVRARTFCSLVDLPEFQTIYDEIRRHTRQGTRTQHA